ncbi:MAG: FHA domain-containing protein [Blastocatellia bacterium]
MDRRCDRGHFYDPAKFHSCPHCGVPGLNVGETMPKRAAAPVADAQVRGNERDEKTRGVLDGMGREPVVGWVVCVTGPDRGKDFKVRPGRNFIGRADSMQIALSGDSSVSREKHAIVTYDPRKNSFGLSPGDSSGLVYLNGEEVDARKELSPYDRIQVGRTELVFMPFCGERFQWPVPANGHEERK